VKAYDKKRNELQEKFAISKKKDASKIQEQDAGKQPKDKKTGA
jgi:hypothetical protein